MATFTISLPDEFAQKIDIETAVKGFATRSEFVRSLLRKYFSGNEMKLEVFKPQSISSIATDLKKTKKYSQKFIDDVTEGLKKSSQYAN